MLPFLLESEASALFPRSNERGPVEAPSFLPERSEAVLISALE